MPILRESRDLNAETPMNLQIENPPRFIASPHTDTNPVSLATTHHRPSNAALEVTEVRSRRAHVFCNRGARAFVAWINATTW
jgi:hypothetical protein